MRLHRATVFAAALASLGIAMPAARAAGPSDFATKVLAWDGTGGMAGYNADPTAALGPPSTLSRPEEPDNASVFSFGWGGSLTLGFDRPIRNDPNNPGGYDFIVFGNAFYLPGDVTVTMAEPGWVEVGVDPTGRGDYGDGSRVLWYWLRGWPAPETTAGFPIAYPNGDVAGWRGYADVTPTDGRGDPLVPDDPDTPGISPGSAGGDAFDLAWAVDADGRSVALDEVHFVRIHGAVDTVRPPLGRISTEVDAVSIVRPILMGDVDGDGTVTLNDAALVARFATGQASLTDDQKRRAGAAPGGEPSLRDAADILRRTAGLPPPGAS